MNDLHRLIYYSRNRIAARRDAMMAEIDQILITSQRNNEPVGVTGALMFNAGCFAQVLEGPRAVLESTFERIQTDERHGDVSLLSFEPIPLRTFGHWSMAFVGKRSADAEAYAGIGSGSGFDPAEASSDEVLQTLQRLAIEDEELAA